MLKMYTMHLIQKAKLYGLSLEEAGFPLKRWWCRNSKSLKQIISEKASDSLTNEENISVLLLNWNSRKDTINTNVPTKRKAVSEISKHYDPAGFFHPVSIKGRVLIQKIWESIITRDEEFSEVLLHQWNQIA